MSHRGTVYIRSGGGVTEFRHRGANIFWKQMCWGPDFLLRAIPADEREEPWYPTAFDESMVFLDVDQQLLLFYGGDEDDFIWEVRSDFVHLLRAAWPGWAVEFAFHGSDDIQIQLGIDERLTPVPYSDIPMSTGISDGQLNQWGRPPDDQTLLGSAVDASGKLRIGWAPGSGSFPGLDFFELPIDSILELVQKFSDRADLAVAPTGGFHLDLATQELLYWRARPISNRARIESRQNDESWTRQHLRGELDAHLGLLGPLCRVSQRPQSERWLDLAGRFLWSNEVDALKTAWSQRGVLDLIPADWPEAPHRANAHFAAVLDRLGVSEVNLVELGQRQPTQPAEYVKTINQRYGCA